MNVSEIVRLSKMREKVLIESTYLSDSAKKRLIDIERNIQNYNYSLCANDEEILAKIDSFKKIKVTKNYSQIIDSEIQSTKEDKTNIRYLAILLAAQKVLAKLPENENIIHNIFSYYRNEIFCYYNESIDFLMKNLNLKVSNLVDVDISNLSLAGIDFFSKKRFFINLNIKHIGRECCWLPYKRILFEGVDFSSAFGYTMRTFNTEDGYKKGLLLEQNSVLTSELVTKYFSKKLKGGTLSLDNNSKILIPSSRREDERTKEAWKKFNLKIDGEKK